jgi:DNA polymerase III subunit beta
MRALCYREGLLSAAQLAVAAVPSKDVKPILKNFKVVAGDGRCTLMATDLEVGIRLDVQGLTVQEPGEAILPAAKLIQILREARDPELHLEADASACKIRGTASTSEFEMPSEDPALFPDFPSFNEDRYHEMSAGTLREMIRHTVFAAAAEESARLTMTGVLWELEGERARLVATDGRRLAQVDGMATPVGDHSTKGQSPVVPKKTMNLMERSLQENPEELVKVCLRPNEVLLHSGRSVIYSRLVDGRFPDYKAVMPKKRTVRIELPAEEFHTKVRQAAIMTDADSKRVTFTFESGQLALQSQGSASGRSYVQMPLDYTGSRIDINFNPDYLIELLKVLPADTVLTLDLIDGANPALFRQGDAYTYLVMPMT